MSDYRSWCGSCNEEINFGGHDPDCEWVHAQRIAEKEVRDFNDALYKEYRDKSDEEILEEAIKLHKELSIYADMQHALGKKWEFLRYELMDKRLIDEFRERTGRRYI